MGILLMLCRLVFPHFFGVFGLNQRLQAGQIIPPSDTIPRQLSIDGWSHDVFPLSSLGLSEPDAVTAGAWKSQAVKPETTAQSVQPAGGRGAIDPRQRGAWGRPARERSIRLNM